ncbi:unnamed protein product, partial [Iphiclides podalirius]
MKCAVVLAALVACAGSVDAAATSCARSQEYFARHNVSADDNDGPETRGEGEVRGEWRRVGFVARTGIPLLGTGNSPPPLPVIACSLHPCTHSCPLSLSLFLSAREVAAPRTNNGTSR